MSDSPAHSAAMDATLVDVLRRQVAERAQQTAFAFHHEEGRLTSWTYQELADRTARVAQHLRSARGTGDAPRAVLCYPPGLDFIAGFLGCVAAGVVPAPSVAPKPRRPSTRLDAIVADCTPTFALTTLACLESWRLDAQSPAVQDLCWAATDALDAVDGAWSEFEPPPPSELTLLQYTSGSTAHPRGVMVTHANLLANLEMIRQGFAMPWRAPDEPPLSGVFWLPAYHDMGLIGGLLTPLYVGGTSHLMAPAAFLRRPWDWLQLMSQTQAVISGAPNFGYQLCVDKVGEDDRRLLDLSAWQLAFCGAEPIDAATLERFATTFAPCGFRASAFYPCYGLAEATLLATGGKGPAAPRVRRVFKSALAEHRLAEATAGVGEADDAVALVGCGSVLGDQELRIVDPQTRQELPPDAVGEIWLRGPAMAAGYWNNPEASVETFGAALADGREGYLRTGDLGGLCAGELYVTGRLKDMVIVRGRNLYPQDIEKTVQQSHDALDRGAAFAVHTHGAEHLVAVHELRRDRRRDDDEPIVRAMRQAIVEEFEVDPAAIVLLRPGALPLTSSGKVQRNRCRELYLAGDLDEQRRWLNPALLRGAAAAHAGAAGDGPLVSEPPDLADWSPDRQAGWFRGWLHGWLAERLGMEADAFDGDTPFAQIGVDSLTAVELIQAVEQQLGLRVSPEAAWTCDTPQELAEYLATTRLQAAASATPLPSRRPPG